MGSAAPVLRASATRATPPAPVSQGGPRDVQQRGAAHYQRRHAGLGGEGAGWRGVLGGLTLATIGNGFDLLNIDTTYQMIVQGGLILIAVAADQLLRRRT